MHIKRRRKAGEPLPPTRAEIAAARPWQAICAKCKIAKTPDDFTPYMRRGHGWCRECCNASRRKRLTPESRRRHNLWSIYRLRPEDYEALLTSQGGGCAICGSADKLHIDHDHACCPGKRSCGKCVRGILCQGCNYAIGHMDEDVARFRAAALYLKRNRP